MSLCRGMASRVSSVLLVFCSLSIVRTEDITCYLSTEDFEESAICIGEEVNDTPWSKEGDKTAPKPDNISYNKLPEDDYGLVTINLIWTQKISHMEQVNGYYVEFLIEGGAAQRFKFTVDKKKFQVHLGNGTYANFNYVHAIPGFSYKFIKLFSLPMYQENHKSQWLELTIEGEPYYFYYPSEYGSSDNQPDDETDRDLPSENSDTGDGTSLPQEHLTQNHETRQTSIELDLVSLPQEHPTQNHETRQSMVTLEVTLMACAITGLATVVLIGFTALICKSCKKVTHIKGRLHPANGFSANRQDEVKPQVLLVTSMADNEPGGNDEFYKKAALCLKSTLKNSGEYDISCSLLTTTKLSEKGVAIWAHELIKGHDKIVVFCSPSMVSNATEHLDSLSDAQECICKDASLQILQSFVRNRHLSNAKLLLVCVDDPPHKCLGAQRLSGLENCKRINLTYEFPKFIEALSPKGKHVAGAKIASMWDDFRKVLEKNRWQQSHLQRACFKMRTASPPRASEHFTDVQYDSVYSSRCNSLSTESTSSHDETGFHECNEKRSRCKETYEAFGARPKMSVAGDK